MYFFLVPLKSKIPERERCRTTSVCFTAGKTFQVVLFLFLLFLSNTDITVSTERLHCANTSFFGLVHHHQKNQPCIVTLEMLSTSYLQNLQMKIPKRICQSSAAKCMAVQLHERGWPRLQYTALHYDYPIKRNWLRGLVQCVWPMSIVGDAPHSGCSCWTVTLTLSALRCFISIGRKEVPGNRAARGQQVARNEGRRWWSWWSLRVYPRGSSD